MPRSKHCRPRHLAVAKALLEGKSQTQACLAGGYSASTAHAAAGKICRSPLVLEALKDLGRNMKGEDLSDIAKGRLLGILTDLESGDNRSLVQAIRLAFELDAKIGPGRIDHQHTHKFSPETMDFIRRMNERKAEAEQ